MHPLCLGQTQGRVGVEIMDPISYESLRKRQPELNLPAWRQLRNTDRKKAKSLSCQDLIAGRVRRILLRKDGQTDRLRPSWEHPMARNDAMAGHWKRLVSLTNRAIPL